MGNAQDKKVEECPDPQTGLTHSECNLIRQTWQHFTEAYRDYGMLIFMSFFIKYPQYMELFRPFRGKHVGLLPNEPHFRAHALAVGYQLTSMVENVEDSSLLDALIRKNAKAHTTRRGTKPDQFVTLGKTIVEVMKTRDEKYMTPAAVTAWEKLFARMSSTTAMVYAEENIPAYSKDVDGSAEAAEESEAGPHGSSPRSKVSKRPNSGLDGAASADAGSSKLASPDYVTSGPCSPGSFDAEAACAEIHTAGVQSASDGTPIIGTPGPSAVKAEPDQPAPKPDKPATKLDEPANKPPQPAQKPDQPAQKSDHPSRTKTSSRRKSPSGGKSARKGSGPT